MPPLIRPRAELPITTSLVRALVREQHPDLDHPSLTHESGGWDNEIFRLGSEYAVRMPRRRMAAGLVEQESAWLPRLADRLPLPVPAPVRRGVPGCGYPWGWAITRWLPGRTVAEVGLADAAQAVEDLSRFVMALGTDAPDDAPRNPLRGVPLAQRDARVRSGIRALSSADEQRRSAAVWGEALAAPVHHDAPVWLHGDLHPANLLAVDGRLSAVIDFGDLTAGDPATDLSVAWMLFGPRERARFRAAVGCDEATWVRARGNALAHGLACLSAADDDPTIGAIGRHTLDAVLAPDA